MLTNLDVEGSRKSSIRKKKFAAALHTWYRRARRPLSWRGTADPYRIWVSEIMLQQTRAAAVEPYYERFLRRFPDLESLARSKEADLLECWSGLGYYSRARNLRRAAQQVNGVLPKTYEAWKALPGVGPYTAAAVASIAFGEPVAVLDGNVIRVMARLTNENGDVRLPRVREELRSQVQALIDRRNPGEFNQALMELGATVCLPRNPLCLLCPISGHCEGFRLGVQGQLPIKLGGRKPVREQITVAVVERNGSLLLWQRPEDASLMPGFWELPQDVEGLAPGPLIREFRHSITYHEYTIRAFRATLQGRTLAGFHWVPRIKLRTLPLTTITKKALEPPMSSDKRRF